MKIVIFSPSESPDPAFSGFLRLPLPRWVWTLKLFKWEKKVRKVKNTHSEE